MKKYIHFLIDLVIIAALVAVDRFTKNAVVANIKGKDPVQIIGDFFTFQYLENTGAAFSILRDQREFFLVISLVFSVIILGLLLYIPVKKKYYPLRIILVFLCAGAIGNMIDRFLFHYVVDFISVGTFPIFNVADIYVTVSTTLLVIFVLFIYKDEDLNFKEANKQKIHSSMLASPAKENEKEKDGENEKALSTVKSSTDTLSQVDVSSSTEAPSVIKVDTSVDSPSVIEVDTSVDPPSVTEVDTSVDSPFVIELKTSVESPSVIEVDTSVDSPSVIELKTSVESPSVIDAKTGEEKPASDKKKERDRKRKTEKKERNRQRKTGI